jgi:type IV pilus assembly protein PilA
MFTARPHRLRARILAEERAFTLIELTVVILILGLLAALAITAFLGQRQKADDADAKAAVGTAATAAEVYFVDNGDYGGMDEAALRQVEPSLADGAAGIGLRVESASGQGYRLSVRQPQTGHVFSTERQRDAAGETTTRTCEPKGAGACPDSGMW